MKPCERVASAERSRRDGPRATRSISSTRRSVGWPGARRPSPTIGSLSAAPCRKSRILLRLRAAWYGSSAMPIDVIMPKVDMVMDAGTIARWHKAEGDTVQVGEALFDLETDKATMEVEAPASGTLT